MIRPPLRLLLLTAALVSLGACAHDDEFAFAADSAHGGACIRAGLDGGSSIPGFGCATDAILRAMVVDQRDLEGGREMAASGGDAALAGVRRHRAGEVKVATPPMSDGVDATIRLEK